MDVYTVNVSEEDIQEAVHYVNWQDLKGCDHGPSRKKIQCAEQAHELLLYLRRNYKASSAVSSSTQRR
jgi:hypothetical protein